MKMRQQFSLRFLLVAMAVFAAWLPFLLNRGGIVRLESELATLQLLAETLTIDDPTKSHLIQRTSMNDNQQVWGVWLPEGRQYDLCIATHGIDDIGFPQAAKRLALDSGREHSILLMLDSEVRSADGMSIRTIVDGEVAWNLEQPFAWNPYDEIQGGVSAATPQTAFPGDKPFFIFQRRFLQLDGDPTVPFDPSMPFQERNRRLKGVPAETPTNGLVLWIEPK
jgi:hypothetical protein